MRPSVNIYRAVETQWISGWGHFGLLQAIL